MKNKVIRANFDDKYIIVYQAYNHLISDSALKNQTFVTPPFKKERMTWIKPSFLWMMYRSGWGIKKNQEHILAIKIKREGFEWALQNSCLSSYTSQLYESHEEWKNCLKTSSVRIQWDPERNLYLEALSFRSIQVGLSNIAVDKYVSDWIVEIKDISSLCNKIHNLIKNNEITQASKLLPKERIYDLPKKISLKINSD